MKKALKELNVKLKSVDNHLKAKRVFTNKGPKIIIYYYQYYIIPREFMSIYRWATVSVDYSLFGIRDAKHHAVERYVDEFRQNYM